MAETKKSLKIFGNDITVYDVPIKSAIEFFNEYELDDGSKIKVKFAATSFVRVEGEYAPDNKPIYLVFAAPAVNVLDSPETLMRPPKAKPN
ncbi:MAG: hypothetical protein ACRD4C_05060 [Candidatus Acidiferrales bacterium]